MFTWIVSYDFTYDVNTIDVNTFDVHTISNNSHLTNRTPESQKIYII